MFDRLGLGLDRGLKLRQRVRISFAATAAGKLNLLPNKHHYLLLLGFPSGFLHVEGKAHMVVPRLAKQNLSSDQ